MAVGQILTSGPERCVVCGRLMTLEELADALYCVSKTGVVVSCSVDCLITYLQSVDPRTGVMYQFASTEPVDAFLQEVNLLDKLGYTEAGTDGSGDGQ